jgi:hypothetical protein
MRAFFAMFVGGVSCIKCTAYALHAFASHEDTLGLPFGETEQKKGTNGLYKAVQSPHPHAPRFQSLIKTCESDEWRLWKEFRNRMSHRSNLPRSINLPMGGPTPANLPLQILKATSSPALDGPLFALAQQRDWLTQAVRGLLCEPIGKVHYLLPSDSFPPFALDPQGHVWVVEYNNNASGPAALTQLGLSATN